MVKCGFCGKKFNGITNWQLHMLRKHPELVSRKNIEGLIDQGVYTLKDLKEWDKLNEHYVN